MTLPDFSADGLVFRPGRDAPRSSMAQVARGHPSATTRARPSFFAT